MAAHERRKNPETDEWMEDVVQSIEARKARMPKRHKQQLPDVPTCTEEQAKMSKFRTGHWQRQKQCNKQILDKSSKQSLQTIQDLDTQEIHTDPVRL